MRSLVLVLCSAWFAAVLAACLDAPVDRGPSVARLVAAWDPVACGDPHRVVLELSDDAGVPRSASAPCNLGGLTLDVARLGTYRGRIYAWALDAPIRSITPVEIVIDQPITHWDVATPP